MQSPGQMGYWQQFALAPPPQAIMAFNWILPPFGDVVAPHYVRALISN